MNDRDPSSASAASSAPPTGASPVAATSLGRSGGGDDTRSALIRAGIDLFGRQGFDGTTTRQIAGAAGVNIAGIAYHFGGKAGLHRACGEAIADLILDYVAPIAVDETALDPDTAADLFVAGVEAMGRFMLGRPEAESVARFMVREQMDPSDTFAILYERLIHPRHAAMCRLFARATGEDPGSEPVVIAVSAMFGQVMFFRVGRATALARLGWEVIDAPRLDCILAVVASTIRATIAARRAAASASSGSRP